MQQLRLKENLLSFHHSDRTHSWFGASLPTQIYGYGRIIFFLSRARYLPLKS